MKNIKLNQVRNLNLYTSFMLLLSFLIFTDSKSQNASIYSNNASISGGTCSAFGYNALSSNSAIRNSALGKDALFSNSTGVHNTGLGKDALYTNNADENAGIGFQVLYTNSSGMHNAGAGAGALSGSNMSDENTAMGFQAGISSDQYHSTAFGSGADIVSGDYNATAIGSDAFTGGPNTIQIGDPSNTSMIFECAPASISALSDGRFKENIKEEVKGIDFIKRLRLVDYNLNMRKYMEIRTIGMSPEKRAKYLSRDFRKSDQTVRTGFIAQEVEQAAKESNYDFDAIHKPQRENDTYALTYGAFVIPLVKAVQEQQVLIENLESRITNQNNVVTELSREQKKNSLSENTSSDKKNSITGFYPDIENQTFVVKYTHMLAVNNAYIGLYDAKGTLLEAFSVGDNNTSFTSTKKLPSGRYYCGLVVDNNVISMKISEIR